MIVEQEMKGDNMPKHNKKSKKKKSKSKKKKK